METNEQEKYRKAKEHVEELKKFYIHLMSYVIVIGFLGGINYFDNQWRYPWFLWAAFGWGIGLAFHAAKTFEINPMYNKDWEERKIKEYMEREEKYKKEYEQERWE